MYDFDYKYKSLLKFNKIVIFFYKYLVALILNPYFKNNKVFNLDLILIFLLIIISRLKIRRPKYTKIVNKSIYLQENKNHRSEEADEVLKVIMSRQQKLRCVPSIPENFTKLSFL